MSNRRQQQRERDAVELDEKLGDNYHGRWNDGFHCQKCLMFIAPRAAVNPSRYCDDCSKKLGNKLKGKSKK